MVNNKVNVCQDIIIEQRVYVKVEAIVDKMNGIKNNVNDKGENALILAIKSKSHSCALILLENNVNNVNN